MPTVNLDNHSPYRPKQSDAVIMLYALGISMLLCLGGVVGVTVFKKFTPVEEPSWNGGGCGGDPPIEFNNDLANTIHASYLWTNPEIDYVPVEEIPLGVYFEGPKVKFYNQMPSWITQEGIVGGGVIKDNEVIVDITVSPDKAIITTSGEEVSSNSTDTKIEYLGDECDKPFLSQIIKANPYEGEDAFRAYVMSSLSLDYYLNRGEEYLFNINFTVGIDGTLSNIVIQSEQGYLPPHVKKDIIKVFNTIPKWQPASQNGRHVSTTFKLPIVVNVQ